MKSRFYKPRAGMRIGLAGMLAALSLAALPAAASPGTAAPAVLASRSLDADGDVQPMIWGIHGFYADYDVCVFVGREGEANGWWRAYDCEHIDSYSYALWVDYPIARLQR